MLTEKINLSFWWNEINTVKLQNNLTANNVIDQQRHLQILNQTVPVFFHFYKKKMKEWKQKNTYINTILAMHSFFKTI